MGKKSKGPVLLPALLFQYHFIKLLFCNNHFAAACHFTIDG
jgi:hypothetical protein